VAEGFNLRIQLSWPICIYPPSRSRMRYSSSYIIRNGSTTHRSW